VHNSGFGHEACTHVLDNLENDKKITWNGNVVYNPQATKRLEKLISSREILVNMSGDVGCAGAERLEWLLKKITSKRLNHHFFTLVTKYPEKVEEILRGGISPRNLGVYVSVESEKYMHRVETLRRLPKSVLKGVWLKPFLGPFSPNVDFSGMLDVVVAGEVARNHRPFPMDALVNCARSADIKNIQFAIEGLSAKDWLTAQQREALARMEKKLRRELKKKKKNPRKN
jgi:protein gp37